MIRSRCVLAERNVPCRASHVSGGRRDMDRQALALAFVNLDGRGLEIGPSYDPLVPKTSGARIETVDHADRASLVEKYTALGLPNEKLAAIEEVDHIWSEGSLVSVFGEGSAFDYI